MLNLLSSLPPAKYPRPAHFLQKEKGIDKADGGSGNFQVFAFYFK
jgi:hypothetical protein